MKIRSLCESSGGLSAADNGAYDNDNDDSPYDPTSAFMNATFTRQLEAAKKNLNTPPYNPSDVGIAPLPRNESDSTTETLNQTGGMWDYLGKVSYKMASLFPGAMGIYTGNRLADYVKTPEVNPGRKPTSKTGGSGVVIAPPEAISPSMPLPDTPPDENPFAHSFDFWRTIMGLPSYESPPGTPPNAPPVTPSGTAPDEIPFWKAFWDKTKTPEADPDAPENFFHGLGDYVGGVFPKGNSPAIPLIAVGIGVVLLIVLIK